MTGREKTERGLTRTASLATELTVIGLTVTELTVTELIVTGLTVPESTVTGLTITELTVTGLTVTELIVTESTVTGLTVTELTLTELTVTELTVTELTVTWLTVTEAKTWEVSDSEEEEEQTGSPTCRQSPAKDDHSPDRHSEPEMVSSDPHSKTKRTSLDPPSKSESISSDGHSKAETVRLDPHSEPEMVSSDPHIKTKIVCLDPHSKTKRVSLDPHSKGPMVSLDPHSKGPMVSLDPHSKGLMVSSDPHSKGLMVSSDPHSETEPVTLDSLVPPVGCGSRASSVSPGRRRRTAEEREEERVRAEERRAQRERARAERERAKEEKREEQRRRKEEAERVKSLKPENCLKALTVRVHPVLLQDCGCDVVLEVLAGLEWSHCIEEHSLTHSITWTRRIPQADGGDGVGAGGVVDEDQVLMVVSQREFMDMVTSIKQALIGGSEEAESLFQPLSEYLNRSSGTVVSLLVTGAQYNQRTVSEDGEDDEDVTPRSQLGLQDIDIEEVLVYLQLFKGVSVHFLFGWQEVTDHVCAVTKALSKRPFKALCDSTDLGFCLDGSWSGGVRVDGSGRGLAQVWTRQIQQLNRVSAAMATAVTSAYPSPSLLLQAYEKAESEEEQRKLLADLTVRGGAKERRVGPELSNRVHRLMTSQNPQLVLD
ncbi:hypothetical protein NFI96_013356 [Prochilodus magdalenae]|nr:hypothetical protein NFI96_013356 [Prochilodus magdalenae]